MDEKLRINIKTMVEQAFTEKGAVQNAQWVEECVRKPHLISVYEMESTSGSTGVDVAILKALLKGRVRMFGCCGHVCVCACLVCVCVYMCVCVRESICSCVLAL